MSKKILSFSVLINLIIYAAIFVATLYPASDPDLGWHLKYGEHFFQTGSVLKDNPYTALMPDYKWTNSSWATDLLSYQSFHLFGFLGLSVLGALVVTLTLFFMGKAAKLNFFEKSIIFPIIVYFTNPVNNPAFRGQILSLLFMSVMFYVLSIFEQKKKAIFVLIPLFLLWSNFHGEFIFGLALFAVWTLVYFVKEAVVSYKTNIKELFLKNKFLLWAFFLSFISVIINPFGLDVYLETFKHLSDPLQKSVQEWVSPVDFSSMWWHLLFIGVVMTLGLAMQGFGKKSLDKAPFYTPSLLIFIVAFWIRRYAWPFFYLSIFLLKPVIHFFEPDNKKHSNILTFVFAVLFFITAFYFKHPFQDILNMNWDAYCVKSVSCSQPAAEAVIDQKLNNEKLLTIYDYGGWLIWNYPEIKPTIDGRMHLWRDEKGFSAFEYYYPIEQNLNGQDIDKSPYNAVLTSNRKPIYNRLIELRKEGKWEAVHVDKYSAVFVRK